MRVKGKFWGVSLFFALLLWTQAAFAASSDVARVEEYMNSLTTLQARFIQMSSSGDIVEGDFYLSRPGKLRLVYDPPMGHFVVADGKLLYHYDAELKQVSYLGLDSTPAGLLVREKHDLASGKEVVVTGTKKEKGLLFISMYKTDDKSAGQITLVFNE